MRTLGYRFPSDLAVRTLGVLTLFSFVGCAYVSTSALQERLDQDGDGVPRPTDCDDTDPEVTTYTFYADSDGDGYGTDVELVTCDPTEGYADRDGDCSDDRADAHPGAAELCNELDDDCDGEIDEEITVDSWYFDGDGDGYGDIDRGVAECDRPSTGYVGNAEDCDDEDSSVHPEATEVCDGRDNDCDHLTDDDDTDTVLDTWYLDFDGDGYGFDYGQSRAGCAAPEGSYVLNADDCDDNRDTSHPGADELCDGYDNDCDSATGEEGTITLDDRQALQTIQEAIDSAIYGSTIRVCPGTYTETLTTETRLTLESSAGANVTTINANKKGAAISITDKVDVVITGFTITGGDGETGGGIDGYDASALSISDCIIEGNRAEYGGGVYGSSLGPTVISGTTISENSAVYDGGGVEVSSGEATLVETIISGNIAQQGAGGLSLQVATATLDESSEISGNTAHLAGGVFLFGGSALSGGTIYENTATFGGGVLALDGGNQLSDVTVESNTATDTGGGVYIYTSDWKSTSTLDLSAATVSENNAIFGGGIAIESAFVSLDEDSEIVSNSASSQGGGLVIVEGGGLSGGSVSENTASYGAGIFVQDGDNQLSEVFVESNSATNTGGGVYVYTSKGEPAATLDLSSTTISRNAALYAGGVAIESSSITLDGGSQVSSNAANNVGGGVAFLKGASMSGGSVSENTSDHGGGILVQDGDNQLSEVCVESNSATTTGGGVYVFTLDGEPTATLDVTTSSISGNSALYGGGMAVESSSITLDESSQLNSNTASSEGGGLILFEGSTLSGGTISENTAEYGGGILVQDGDNQLSDVTIEGNSALLVGGGLYVLSVLSSTTIALADCAVVGNEAASLGGGAYLYEGALTSDGSSWGADSNDNAPDDVTILSSSGAEASYADYGAAESFTCSTDLETCE